MFMRARAGIKPPALPRPAEVIMTALASGNDLAAAPALDLAGQGDQDLLGPDRSSDQPARIGGS
jgi:hypothetical protein